MTVTITFTAESSLEAARDLLAFAGLMISHPEAEQKPASAASAPAASVSSADESAGTPEHDAAAEPASAPAKRTRAKANRAITDTPENRRPEPVAETAPAEAAADEADQDAADEAAEDEVEITIEAVRTAARALSTQVSPKTTQSVLKVLIGAATMSRLAESNPSRSRLMAAINHIEAATKAAVNAGASEVDRDEAVMKYADAVAGWEASHVG